MFQLLNVKNLILNFRPLHNLNTGIFILLNNSISIPKFPNNIEKYIIFGGDILFEFKFQEHLVENFVKYTIHLSFIY